jgi:hypothetical protein
VSLRVTFNPRPELDTEFSHAFDCRVRYDSPALDANICPRFHVTYHHGKALPPPTENDVLDSIARDAEYASLSFTQWCDEFMENPDSRRVHATWVECRRIAEALTRILRHERMTLAEFIESRLGEMVEVAE